MYQKFQNAFVKLFCVLDYKLSLQYNSHMGEPSKEPVSNTYFDLESRTLIYGDDKLDRFYILTDKKTEVYPLRQILRDENIQVPDFVYSRKETRSKASLLKYGHWLSEVVGEPEDRYKRQLNKDIIRRAARIGIGPSVWEITSHPAFKSMARYYTELGLTSTKRAGMFDDWTVDEFGEYIRSLAEELGRKPTRADLVANASSDTNSPSINVIISKLGSLGNAYEAAGVDPNSRRWTADDMLSWGVQFIEANEGLIPTQSSIDFLSKKNLCPSATIFAKRFDDSLLEYRSHLGTAYHLEMKDRNNLRRQKLSAIESGSFPPALFDGAQNEQALFAIYARYIVMEELLGEGYHNSKLSVSRLDTATAATEGFERCIRKINNAITCGDIETTALYLGVFEDIWPPDKLYLEKLKLPDDYPKPKTKGLYIGQLESDQADGQTHGYECHK